MDEALFNADISIRFSHIQWQLFEQWKSALDILQLVNIKIERDEDENDDEEEADNDILNQSIVNSILMRRVPQIKDKKIKTERTEFK